MRRIRLLLSADAVGGVWTYALDLAEGLAPLGFDVTLAVLGPAPDRAMRDAAARIPGLRLVVTGLPLDWTAGDPAALAQASDALAALAADIGADLVQLHTPALVSGAFAMPVVAVSHSCVGTWWKAMRGDAPMPEDLRWRAAAVERGLRDAAAIVAPSAAFAALTAATYPGAGRLRVVRNGRRSPVPAVREPAPRDVVLAAGRLWDEAKDVATLDAAAALLRAPVLAAGPLHGPGGNTVSLAHARPLGSLCGAALARWMVARPVFVSISRYEPFGLAVLEAAWSGCPLVLSDIPTFRELWDGVALFVPPGDPRALADAVDGLLWDHAARKRAGAAARARAADYAPGPMAAAMAALHLEVLRLAPGKAAA